MCAIRGITVAEARARTASSVGAVPDEDYEERAS